MKEMVKDQLLGRVQSGAGPDPHGHSLHCIDWVKQALICNADVSLDSTTDFQTFGEGDIHRCRNFDKIRSWAQEHRYKGSLAELSHHSVPVSNDRHH
jgi:hypothetical protein